MQKRYGLVLEHKLELVLELEGLSWQVVRVTAWWSARIGRAEFGDALIAALLLVGRDLVTSTALMVVVELLVGRVIAAGC